MSEGEYDLTGEWSGIYNFPSLYPPNSFEASIRDSAGIIAGEISEPGAPFGRDATYYAVIEGSHEGSRLSFIKVYDDMSLDPVHYEGVIQPDGDEIEGRWTLPGNWSGTFLMIRGSKAAQVEERRISEDLELR